MAVNAEDLEETIEGAVSLLARYDLNLNGVEFSIILSMNIVRVESRVKRWRVLYCSLVAMDIRRATFALRTLL